jgi:hypothetical protein
MRIGCNHLVSRIVFCFKPTTCNPRTPYFFSEHFSHRDRETPHFTYALSDVSSRPNSPIGMYGESSQLRQVCCLLPKLTAPEHNGANYTLQAGGRRPAVAATAAAGAATNSQLLDLVAGLEVTQQLPVLPVLCALTIPHLRMNFI